MLTSARRRRRSFGRLGLAIGVGWLWLALGVVECATHWKVNDGGFVEAKDDTPYTILRPYDLAAFIKQADRVERLRELRDLINSKEHINKYGHTKLYVPTSVSTYQENFYKTDQDCLRAGQQLTKFAFYETHHNLWRVDEISLPKEILQIREADVQVFKKPSCQAPLPFNLKTFDHLESIFNKDLISMAPDTELLANIFVESEDFYGHLVHKALQTNATSWMYLTMAADFYRIKGDYSNTIKCLQRAVYYAPRIHLTMPVLSLSNVLHKLHFSNDSLSVALSSLSFDPFSPLFAYHAGNIYVTLGDLNLAFNAYEKAFHHDPMFKQAYAKKHAVLCHLKLEQYLEEQHLNLQKKLDEIKEYQTLTEEWIHENAAVELEKSSPDRREVTKSFYEAFMQDKPSRVCRWEVLDENKMKLACTDLKFHYSHLETLDDLNWLLNETSLAPGMKHEPNFSFVKQLVSGEDQEACLDQSRSEKENCPVLQPEHYQETKEPYDSKTESNESNSDDSDEEIDSAQSPALHNQFTEKLLREKSVENRIKIPDYISIF